MTGWVRKAALNSVSSEPNHEFRSSEGKVEGRVFQARGEQGVTEKDLMEWGRGRCESCKECGAPR